MTYPVHGNVTHSFRTRDELVTTLLISFGIVLSLTALFWLGLRVRPIPFPPFPQRTPDLPTVPLPEGLPAPVARFYHSLYGDRLPVIESAVITGRASLRIKGFTFPARFRFTHLAGRAYRHYIEATFFGLPLMKVNEHFLDGRGRLENPFGVTEADPKVDQGANLALWAEAFWFPAVLVTDRRVSWEAVDENTALLIVPFYEESRERFVVRFDPESGMAAVLEAMRFKGTENRDKVLWMDEVLDWGEVAGCPTFTVGRVTWFDDKLPWARFETEDMVLNADVSDYVRVRGV